MPLGAARVVLLAVAGAAGTEDVEFEAGAVLRLEEDDELLLADGASRLLLVPQEEPE
jgi:hypothetical protein